MPTPWNSPLDEISVLKETRILQRTYIVVSIFHENMVIYDKHCIIKHIPCPTHYPLDVMIGKAKPSLITRDTLGETVGWRTSIPTSVIP